MGKINVGRVILGGVVAGIIINIFEDVLNGAILVTQWDAAMAVLGKPPLTAMQVLGINIWGFILGWIAIWIYAAIRPRFGAGLKTAVIAGIAMWAAVRVSGFFSWTVPGLFPVGYMLVHTVVGFFEMIAATIAGAWLYKEK